MTLPLHVPEGHDQALQSDRYDNPWRITSLALGQSRVPDIEETLT